jgi:hypothetical protein
MLAAIPKEGLLVSNHIDGSFLNSYIAGTAVCAGQYSPWNKNSSEGSQIPRDFESNPSPLGHTVLLKYFYLRRHRAQVHKRVCCTYPLRVADASATFCGYA